MIKFALVVMTFLSIGTAAAADNFSMRPHAGCSIIPLKDKASDMQISRIGQTVIVTVRSNTFCNVEPENPTLSRAENTATISVSYDITKALHNCSCAKTIDFEIKSLAPEIKTIYFLQDRYVLGHATVP